MGISGMVYMSSSFWLLAVESCDLPQTKKDITASKAEQIHKMTPIFTQNGHFCEFAQCCKQLFFSQLEKYHVIQETNARN